MGHLRAYRAAARASGACRARYSGLHVYLERLLLGAVPHAGDDAAPITVGVAALRGQWTTAWNLVSAGSVLAALPSVLMFFAMQKHFVAGLTFGATKG